MTTISVKNDLEVLLVSHMRYGKLKWRGMGEFNPDDHYIYYCDQEFHRRNGVALIINKSQECSTWAQPQKQNDLSLFARQVVQHHSNSNLCPYHRCQRS